MRGGHHQDRRHAGRRDGVRVLVGGTGQNAQVLSGASPVNPRSS